MIKLNDENIDVVCASLNILIQGIKNIVLLLLGKNLKKN